MTHDPPDSPPEPVEFWVPCNRCGGAVDAEGEILEDEDGKRLKLEAVEGQTCLVCGEPLCVECVDKSETCSDGCELELWPDIGGDG